MKIVICSSVHNCWLDENVVPVHTTKVPLSCFSIKNQSLKYVPVEIEWNKLQKLFN